MSSSWTVLNTTFGKTNISFMAWQTLVHAIIASLDWLEHRQWNCKSISLSCLLPAHENLVIISLKRSFVYFQFATHATKWASHRMPNRATLITLNLISTWDAVAMEKLLLLDSWKCKCMDAKWSWESKKIIKGNERWNASVCFQFFSHDLSVSACRSIETELRRRAHY